MYNNYKHFSYYDVITRLSLTILKVDFERFLLDQESTALTDDILPETPNAKSTSDDEAMMKWMQVKDHLMYESFEDFYEDMVERLARDGKRITLNNDLCKHREARNAAVDEKNKSVYTSKVITYVGSVVHQMRVLVKIMKERR